VVAVQMERGQLSRCWLERRQERKQKQWRCYDRQICVLFATSRIERALHLRQVWSSAQSQETFGHVWVRLVGRCDNGDVRRRKLDRAEVDSRHWRWLGWGVMITIRGTAGP
jgi:hypothetical protein